VIRWLGAALALLVAGAIYLAFRTETLAMFTWADAAGQGGAIAWLRSSAAPLCSALPAVLLYSVPDALWQYAFAFVLFRLSSGAAPLERALWCALPIAIGIGLELGQGARVVEGTFDPVDLLLGSLAIVLAWIVARARSPKGLPHVEYT
jgi:hypothetical protein